MKSYQITEFCHRFIEDHVYPGDVCVDATAGNGNDTAFLCRLVGDGGKVYAFDIQKEALLHTEEKLRKENLQAKLVLDGHENMEAYVAEKGEVACIVFNFGYLPGGDNRVATCAKTSVTAIKAGLKLLRKGGLMSLCIYSGGDTGFEEKDAILDFLKELDSTRYLVIESLYRNRSNHPPIPVQIVKIEGE